MYALPWTSVIDAQKSRVCLQFLISRDLFLQNNNAKVIIVALFAIVCLVCVIFG